MLRNLKFTVAYDGTSLFGWQLTQEGPSVEEVLKATCEQILQERITLQAASRTDRGVHATGQVVHFFTKKTLSVEALKKGLNALLPPTIRVVEGEEMGLSFHPTLDAVGKEYCYHLSCGPFQLPAERLYSWHIPCLLDLEKMREACPLFLGIHDFTSFCNQRKNLNYPDKKRELFKLEIVEKGEGRITIVIAGNHFLYKMVRTIVGTVVEIGMKKKEPSAIVTLLKEKNRPLAGPTAPAHGLFLTRIYYPEML